VAGILEYGAHAFLVRFWVEPREIADAPPGLRAHVEYLLTGEVCNVATARDLHGFMTACLADAGVPVPPAWLGDDRGDPS
jgi:hypothetical protein